MKNTQRHIIREQLIELTVGQEAVAWEHQQAAGQIFRQRMLPLIDRYLSECCDPDTLIRLDTLEIDLGEVDPMRLGLDLEEQLRRQLRPALAQAIRRSGGVSPAQQKKQKAFSHLTVLHTFITSGVLPWWADAGDTGLLERSWRYLLQHRPAVLKARLVAYGRREPHLHRLIHSLGDEHLLAMVPMFAESIAPFIGELIRDLQRRLPQIPQMRELSGKRVRREFWKGLFYTLTLDPRSEWTAEQLQRRVLLHLATAFSCPFSVLVRVIRQDDRRKRLLSDGSAMTEATTEEQTPAPVAGEAKFKKTKDGSTTEKKDLDDLAFPSTVEDSREVYVYNAGLVLLGPYLLRFLENVGLVKDKAFVDELAPHRAMVLLQFLAAGNAEPPEYQLPLNKVLCGISLETPHDAVVELEETLLEAGEFFLEAVIANAPLLGKLSIDGFRNTFLRRPGILSFEDGHWLLRVERETYDVVLDRLPWGFKIVKLPWMMYGLYTEW